jgi:hypothetical protein
MFAHLVAAAKRAAGLYHPRRDLLILPDDVFLVSFPKSGNTWARFLISNLMHPDKPADFANLYKLVPDPFGTPKRVFARIPRPRVIKSHECFDPRYPRVIYIARDPRDVVVSQYHYHRKCRKIEDGYPIEQFVARFLAGQTCPHGSWGEHAATWLATRRNDPRFLLLRYEDMVSNIRTELAKIAAFLSISTSPELLSQAAERSSADRMRKLEREQSQLTRLTKDSRKDLAFVRAASSGGWRNTLSPTLAAEIDTAWCSIMRYLGYEVSAGAAGSPLSEFMEPILNANPR